MLDFNSEDANKEFNLNYIIGLIFLLIGVLFNIIFLVIIIKNVKTKSFHGRKPMGFLLIGLPIYV